MNYKDLWLKANNRKSCQCFSSLQFHTSMYLRAVSRSEMEGSWVKEVSLWCAKNTNKVCCSQLTLRPKHLAQTSPPHIPGVTAHLTGCDLSRCRSRSTVSLFSFCLFISLGKATCKISTFQAIHCS